jgi:hypothetical protein
VSRTGVLILFQPAVFASPDSPIISNLLAGHMRWSGWDSNPRPADYEKYGLLHHRR